MLLPKIPAIKTILLVRDDVRRLNHVCVVCLTASIFFGNKLKKDKEGVDAVITN